MRKNIGVEILKFCGLFVLIIGCAYIPYSIYEYDYEKLFWVFIPFCAYFLMSFLLGKRLKEKMIPRQSYVGILFLCFGIALIPWVFIVMYGAFLYNASFLATFVFLAPAIWMIFMGILWGGRNLLEKESVILIGLIGILALSLNFFLNNYFSFGYEKFFPIYLPMFLIRLFPVDIFSLIGVIGIIKSYAQKRITGRIAGPLACIIIAGFILWMEENNMSSILTGDLYENSVKMRNLGAISISSGILAGFLVNALCQFVLRRFSNYFSFFFAKAKSNISLTNVLKIKKCPMCACKVHNDAKVCRFCGYKFDKEELEKEETENV